MPRMTESLCLHKPREVDFWFEVSKDGKVKVGGVGVDEERKNTLV